MTMKSLFVERLLRATDNGSAGVYTVGEKLCRNTVAILLFFYEKHSRKFHFSLPFTKLFSPIYIDRLELNFSY